MSKRVIVTGGAGFLGRAVVARLARAGHDVVVADDVSRGSASKLAIAASGVELVKADVRDTGAMIKVARDADMIVHLAAVNGTRNFYQKPEAVLDVGVRGMLAVLDAARANRVREFMLVSSSEVYQTPSAFPTPETEALSVPDVWEPRYSYGASKIASEVMLANYCRDVFERVMILRPHNVYGPDMGHDHVIPELVRRASEACLDHATGQVELPVQGDGTQTRSFIHVEDFAKAFLLIFDKGHDRTVYNVGTDQEISIARLVDAIFRILQRQHVLRFTAAPAGAVSRRQPDVGRLSALGFQATWTLDDGLRDLIAKLAQTPATPTHPA